MHKGVELPEVLAVQMREMAGVPQLAVMVRLILVAAEAAVVKQIMAVPVVQALLL